MAILSVGVTGLNAAQVGLQVTSHNISNASTPGYNRQSIVQATNTPMFSGNGFIGQGTSVINVLRNYSDLLRSQVLSSETTAAESDAYLFQIQQIDNMLADDSVGLSPALAAFFQGVQGVAANPSSIPARQTMMESGQSLVSRFQAMDQRMGDIRDGINSQITTEVSTINTYADQLADINQRIILAMVGGRTQPPNDLLDQRDQIVTNLNKEIRVTTAMQSDGTMNVFIGNGQPLVVGTQKSTLTAVTASDDPERTTINIQFTVGSNAASIPESLLSGGKLGGLLSFRSETLNYAQNALGRIAIGLAQQFNDQHQLGVDLTGVLGGQFFNVPGPISYANSNNANSAENITVTVNSVANLSTSDYRLTYDGTNYTLMRLEDKTIWTSPDFTNWTSGATTTTFPIDGITLGQGTWNATVGDNFLIEPTRAGARNIALKFSDPRSIAAAAPIRTAPALANTGTARISAGTVDMPVPPATLDPNLQNSVTITFTSANTYDVVDAINGTLATNVAYTSGSNISYNGWTVQIEGSPATNDVFTVGANSNGVADSRNAVLLGKLQTANNLVGSTATYQTTYAQMVAKIGNKANAQEVINKAQTQFAQQSTNKVEELSGVNLDEEAANLLRYQQAYQASAKIISIAGVLFDTILSIKN